MSDEAPVPPAPGHPAQHAVLAGLTPLIPLPFVDGLVLRRIQRSAYGRSARHAGVELPKGVLDALSDNRGSILLGCLVAAFWWPIKKLVKTLFYFLTIKECFDTAAEVALRSEMVRRAASRGLLPDQVEPVRASMDAAIKAHTGSPILGWFTRKGALPLELPTGDPMVPLLEGLAKHAGGHAALTAFEHRLDALPPVCAVPQQLPPPSEPGDP